MGNRLFLHLSRKILAVAGDPAFKQTVEELRWRGKIFDQLLRSMRIADPGGREGLNDDGSKAAMAGIREGVFRFRGRLKDDLRLASDPLCGKMAEQIDRYADKLFADPIQVKTPSRRATVYPQRTNNILEQFFRSLRRDHRRRSGDNSMHRALQTILADTPLVKNLSNPDYMEVLLDGRPNLEALFADLDITAQSSELVQPLKTIASCRGSERCSKCRTCRIASPGLLWKPRFDKTKTSCVAIDQIKNIKLTDL